MYKRKTYEKGVKVETVGDFNFRLLKVSASLANAKQGTLQWIDAVNLANNKTVKVALYGHTAVPVHIKNLTISPAKEGKSGFIVADNGNLSVFKEATISYKDGIVTPEEELPPDVEFESLVAQDTIGKTHSKSFSQSFSQLQVTTPTPTPATNGREAYEVQAEESVIANLSGAKRILTALGYKTYTVTDLVAVGDMRGRTTTAIMMDSQRRGR